MLQLILLLHQANLVVRQLLQLGLPLSFAQVKVLRDVPDLLGNLAKYFLTASQGALEHADAEQTAFVDVGIYGSRRDQVDDRDALALLAVAVDATDSLFHTHRIPGQVVVHDAVAELVVKPLTTYFRKQQKIKTVRVVTRPFEATAQLDALLVGRPAVDHGDAYTVGYQPLIQIAQGVTEAAEQHDLVVGQCLFVPDDRPKTLEFRIMRI